MPRRLKVTEVNSHVKCTICDGYLIDATAIIECLHAFCRTCIVRYLENSKFCPVCDVQVHKTRPLLSIRSDQTLQDLVYKVVPGLYQNEMQKRREFYAEHPEAALGTEPEERGEGEPRFFSPSELISLSLHHRPKDVKLPESSSHGKDPTTRHLSCPAAFTVGHLKKFICFKFSLPSTYVIDIFYEEQPLKDSFSLMDVAYIYAWKRAEPMKFFYTVSKRAPKILASIPAALPPPAEPETDVAIENAAEVEVSPTEQMQVDPELPDSKSEQVVDENPVLSAQKEQVSCGAENVQMVTTETKKVEVVSSEMEQIPEVSPQAKVQLVPPEKMPAEMSSTDTVEPMDTIESEAVKPCISSLPEIMLVPPPMPEPIYNSVKLVTTPERDAVLSPTNGFRLKFIHDPKLSPKSPKSKKSGKKGGRSSRHKGVPVRLARLAPYPPPPPPSVPVTCLTTQQLPQLAVGKLIPSVISTLAPTFVTTLVSSTSSNTLGKVTNNSCMPKISPFLSQVSTAVHSISTHSISVPSGSTENGISLSSTINGIAISTSSDMISTPAIASKECLKDSPVNTKELPSTEMKFETESVVPSCSSPSLVSTTICSVPKNHDISHVLKYPVVSLPSSPLTNISNSALTNSSVSQVSVTISNNLSSADIHVSDSTQSDNKQSTTNASAAFPKSVDCSETVSSTSTDSVLHISSVPTNTDCEPEKKISITENHSMMNGDKKDCLILQDKEPIIENADQKSESFKMSVKNSISAEFSDNDDLGCQSDLVVDEQKMDSSDNEEDTDAALRKKINAIAEKEDEADVTDDTEADSGRASDMSCPARCEDDVGSPATTTEAITSTSSSSVSVHNAITTTASVISTSSSSEVHRHVKANNIDQVIKQLHLHREIGRIASSPKPVPSSNASQVPVPAKDDNGVLDLSTCTRKPGEINSPRPKSVANPVLDIKHRQQTYMPAPSKQHTACPPAPKHPTSPLLMRQLTAHHNTTPILQAQLTGSGKPSHRHLPYSSSSVPFTLPVSRTVSSPSSTPMRPCQPTFSYRLHKNTPRQSSPMSMFPGMLSYPMMDMASYAVRSGMVPGMPIPARSSPGLPIAARSSPSTSHSKEVSSSSKMPSFSSGIKTSSSSIRRLSETLVSSSPHPGHCRLSTVPSPTHPRTSPSMLTRMSPHHRSASPAPSPQNVTSITNSMTHMSPHHRSASPAPSPQNVTSITNSMTHMSPHHRSASPAPSPQNITSMANSLTASSISLSRTPPQCKTTVPIFKKSGFKLKRNANLAVFNPDPNGYRQKIVIKNLDVQSNNHH